MSDEKNELRIRILGYLYEREDEFLSSEDVCEALNIDHGKGERALEYLFDEALLEKPVIGAYQISHDGVVAMEELQAEATTKADEDVRYQILQYAMKDSKGSSTWWMCPELIFEAVGVEESQGKRALQYLVNEGLMRLSASKYALTHQGIKEIEDARKHPEKRTEHFTVNVINNNYNAPVGAAVTGDNNTINLGPQVNDILELVRDIRSSLPDDSATRQPTEELLAEIGTQVRLPQPNKTVLTSLASMLSTSLIAMELGSKGVELYDKIRGLFQ